MAFARRGRISWLIHFTTQHAWHRRANGTKTIWNILHSFKHSGPQFNCCRIKNPASLSFPSITLNYDNSFVVSEEKNDGQWFPSVDNMIPWRKLKRKTWKLRNSKSVFALNLTCSNFAVIWSELIFGQKPNSFRLSFFPLSRVTKSTNHLPAIRQNLCHLDKSAWNYGDEIHSSTLQLPCTMLFCYANYYTISQESRVVVTSAHVCPLLGDYSR